MESLESLLFNRKYAEISLEIQKFEDHFATLHGQLFDLEQMVLHLSGSKKARAINHRHNLEERLFWCSTKINKLHIEGLKLIASCTPNPALFYSHISALVEPISIENLPQLSPLAQQRLKNHE